MDQRKSDGCTALPWPCEEGMYLAITMAPMYLAALPVGLISGADAWPGLGRDFHGAGRDTGCHTEEHASFACIFAVVKCTRDRSII